MASILELIPQATLHRIHFTSSNETGLNDSFDVDVPSKEPCDTKKASDNDYLRRSQTPYLAVIRTTWWRGACILSERSDPFNSAPSVFWTQCVGHGPP
jgi:hypothetical protein